ncbi:unnamed protein product [Brachionus calyciflorus]|uniref:Uncharacterized protein n=1 Tax=Brachionus calyciflorus TaxID=104777 RepID=A0A813M5U5_9BILA|nr:unnamed protein product [Brachionus calyciflorus]
MGCASSKPSSSKDKNKKNIKPKKTSQNVQSNEPNGNVTHTPSHKLNGSDSTPSKLDKTIELSPSLIEEIDLNHQKVINYISHIVHRDLNAELINQSHKPPQASSHHHSANLASVVLAAAVAKENDDLIQDVASKAVFLITNKNENYQPKTYKELNESLKAAHYLFKHQNNKNRIIDLTVDTIENSINAINQEIANRSEDFSLDEFLNKNDPEIVIEQLTPPETPETKVTQPIQSTPNLDWDSAQLLSRSQANEVARILFLSNKARPVVHASPKAKDAYIVNKQVNDKEIALTKDEIDEILNRNDEQPKFIELVNNLENLSPISPNLNAPSLNDTPQVISIFSNRANNLANDLNELCEHDENVRTEEINNNYVNDTIQYEPNEEENFKQNEINIEYLPGAVNNAELNEQSDNVNNTNDPILIYQTTTVISKTTLIATPLDTQETLDKNILDPILKQSLLDDRFYNNDSFKTEPPVNGEAENEAAVVIQSAFRSHEARQGDGDKQTESSLNAEESNIEQEENYENVINPEDEKAAIKIQATYRGFKTRKELHNKQQELLKDNNNQDESTLSSNSARTIASFDSNKNNNKNHKLEKCVDADNSNNDLVEDYIHNNSNYNTVIISNTSICSMDSNKRDKENESKSLLDRAATKIQRRTEKLNRKNTIQKINEQNRKRSNLCGIG